MCDDCIARFAVLLPRCGRCGLRLALAVPACGACLHDAPPFAHTVAAVDYAFPWDRLIAAFKFRDRSELASTLAERLLAALAARSLPLPQLLLPVPLAPARLVERGYNQAWELVRRLSRRLGLDARHDVLRHCGSGVHQIALDRAARRRNLRGVFSVAPAQAARLAGRHVALVDDVMTTAATAEGRGAALLAAVRRSVDVWVVARTPPRH